MREGVDISVSQLHRADVIRELAGFAPVVPRFSVPPTLVQVLLKRNGGPSVVFVYHFPREAGMPADGRVVVSEQPEHLASRSGPRFTVTGDDRLLHLSNGGLALVRQNRTTASVWISLPGVLISVDGPALPPAVAQRLAESFG